jgi:hypothetical protein
LLDEETPRRPGIFAGKAGENIEAAYRHDEQREKFRNFHNRKLSPEYLER